MIDIQTLEEAASVINNGQEDPVIQFPLRLWQQYKHTIRAKNEELLTSNQAEHLLWLLNKWNEEAEDTSDEWWNEFQNFINQNRLNLAVAGIDRKPSKAQKNKNYHVVPDPQGGWNVRHEAQPNPVSYTTTQAEAISIASERARKDGSEVFIYGRNGQIRERINYENASQKHRGD